MFSAIGFGLMPFFAVKVYAAGGNPVFLTFCRFLLSLPLLFFLAKEKHSPKASVSEKRRNFFHISFAFTITPFLLFLSYTYIASSLATAIHFLYPAFVLIICRFFFKQETSLAKYVCCLLCITGVVFLCVSEKTLHPVGLLSAFASAVSYAVYVSFLPVSGLQNSFTPFQLTFYMNLLGACLMAVANICFDTWAFSISFSGWFYTLLLSWGTAVGSTILFQAGIRLCGSQNAAILSTLEPVTSVVLGTLFLKESLSFSSFFGIVLILFSVFLLSVSGPQKKIKKEV